MYGTHYTRKDHELNVIRVGAQRRRLDDEQLMGLRIAVAIAAENVPIVSGSDAFAVELRTDVVRARALKALATAADRRTTTRRTRSRSTTARGTA